MNRSGADLVRLLLKNELRLWWRVTTGKKNFWIGVVVLWLFVTFVLVSLWFGLSPLRLALGETTLPDAALWVAVGLWLLGFIFAFNQAMGESVVVLFERGDLDLLLSSPVSSRAIFAVRLLSVTLSTFFGFGVFILPATVLAALVGYWSLLGLYPALLGICLVAASLAMLVTLRVVRWVGARRARGLVQILNLFLSLAVILTSQLPNLLISTDIEFGALWERLEAWTAPGQVLGIDSWVWFPARSMLLEPVSVVLTLMVSGAIAFFTIYTLDKAFVEGTQQSVTQKRRARAGEGTAVRDGFVRVMLAKEWRTMRRHPYLISQVTLQVVLVLPLTWVLLSGDGDNPLLDIGRIASVALPVLAGQLAYVLTFVCLSGEEAADLLKSAPVASVYLRRMKQLAALIPVWLLLLPAVIILIVQGYPWLSTLLVTIGASVGSSFFRLWNSRPVPSGELFRQRQLAKTDIFLMILEVSAPWVWVGLSSALYTGSGFFVGLSVLGLVLLFSLGYGRGYQLGSFLHY